MSLIYPRRNTALKRDLFLSSAKLNRVDARRTMEKITILDFSIPKPDFATRMWVRTSQKAILIVVIV